MKIRGKMLIPMIAIALATTIAILTTVTVIFSNYVDDTSAEEIERATNVMLSEYEWQIDESTNCSTLISEDSLIRQALADGDRDALVERALHFDALMDIDFITITDTEGNVVVRAHEPDNYGDSVAGQMNVQQALAGNTYTTLEQGSAVRLSVRAGVPIYSDGVLVGVVSSGYRLDTETFVDHIKDLTGTEVTVFLGDERISTTVTNDAGDRVVGTKAAENVSQIVLAGEDYSGSAKVVERDALVQYVPIANAQGEVLGMLFVGTFTDVKWDAVGAFLLQGGLVALVVLAVAVAVTMVVTSRIVTPIKTMVVAADRLADGETDVEVQVNTKDEVHDLAEAFKRMIAGSQEQERVIVAMAEGDLSVEVAMRSDKDAVAMALRRMLEMNNQVFRQIRNAAEQVAGSSQQLANGSQNLAQGSTEQAGVVEELSASIATVAANARDNAELATSAAALSGSIRENAEKGSEQMKDLTTAVNEINEASQAIAGVIKVIDDIAFQTNILALNAAVEAARAGEHGKGFAVVADEVRNLAGKSADAAKDTSAMISNSIEKAELGATIAATTAESLGEIVNGINENSRMVNDIAASSSGASDAIGQINVGIDQVAQVVQQNSATAEESAAASQEMNGQSEMLRNLVGRFKLQDEFGKTETVDMNIPMGLPAGDVM